MAALQEEPWPPLLTTFHPQARVTSQAFGHSSCLPLRSPFGCLCPSKLLESPCHSHGHSALDLPHGTVSYFCGHLGHFSVVTPGNSPEKDLTYTAPPGPCPAAHLGLHRDTIKVGGWVGMQEMGGGVPGLRRGKREARGSRKTRAT